MCWIGDMKPIVADADILVYKIGKTRGLFSKRFRPIYYSDFVYKKGIPVPLVKINQLDNGFIFEGYHSFAGPDKAINYAYKFIGRHYSIGVFKIPKGTIYYINEAHVVVSETLVYLYKYPEHLHGFWIDRFRRLLGKTY